MDMQDKNAIPAPKCKTLPHVRKYTNQNNPSYIDETPDPYHWLSDKSNPEVIDYLKAENSYTKECMRDTDELQKQLFDEIKSRIQETDTSAPWPHDDYLYYFRTVEKQEYSIFCRKLSDKQTKSPEEILLDENILAADHEFFSIGDIEVSPCHKYLAYTADTTGDEQYQLFIKNLLTDTIINISEKYEIGDVSAGLTWSADSLSIIYIKLDPSLRPYQVWAFTQSDHSNILLFTEADERFWTGAELTRTLDFILIHSQSKLSSEVYYLPATGISKESTKLITSIKPRQQHVEYYVDHYKSTGKNSQQSEFFYILINSEQKPNFELYRTDINSKSVEEWELLISHKNDIKLANIDCFADYCVLLTRENGLNQLKIIPNYDFGNIIKLNIEKKFNEQVYDIGPGHNEMFKNQFYYFDYESLATPHSVYKMDTSNTDDLQIELVKQDPVLNNFNRNNYISERIFIESSDKSVKIPLSIIYNKQKYKKDGTHGALLYGYGSYGISIDPYFSHSRISLLDRGMAYIIAHIRGGGELGETWHYAGRLNCKTNTFSDFISAAEYLTEHQYTSSDKLAIQGGSAGGLLIGNVINQKPELFKAAIAEVPFVDCLNTMLDPSLPLTITEYEEWGNPTNELEVYQYIKSYAPYENVTTQKYPNLLINNSLEDYRVSYWEAAKWTAKLRVHQKADNTILLKTQMTAGHGGASGRYQALHEVAFNYSFVLKYLNLD